MTTNHQKPTHFKTALTGMYLFKLLLYLLMKKQKSLSRRGSLSCDCIIELSNPVHYRSLLSLVGVGMVNSTAKALLHWKIIHCQKPSQKKFLEKTRFLKPRQKNTLLKKRE